MKKYFVKGSEVLTAIRNWNDIMNLTPEDGTQSSFTTFIGERERVLDMGLDPPSLPSWGWKVTEPAYKKIKMLASPHHYALLKAFKAKTGWQGNIP